MRVLIFGSKGVLGREVTVAAYNCGYYVYTPEKANADIASWMDVRKVVDYFRPEVVINCAGIIRGRELPNSKYLSINGLAPHIISEVCDEFSARLIHISTDCVFSGFMLRGHRWYEDSNVNPSDIYGRSKLAGEIYSPPHLTIRCSFIGFGERGLLAWLLNQNGRIPGYTKSFWNGVTAPHLATIIMILLPIFNITGLVHIFSNEIVSKYELLHKLAYKMRLPVEVYDAETPKEHFVNRCLGTKYTDILSLLPEVSLSSMIDDLVDDYALMR